MSETNATPTPNPQKSCNGKTKVGAVLDVTVEKMRAMADSSTIIGEQIVLPDSTVLIPVSKVSYGFASGGSDFASKKTSANLFAGGGGGGMTVTPVAFIAVKDGDVQVLNLLPTGGEAAMGVAERAVAMAPELIDKIRDLFKKKDEKED